MAVTDFAWDWLDATGALFDNVFTDVCRLKFVEQALDLGAIVDLAGGAVFKEFCDDDLVNFGGG